MQSSIPQTEFPQGSVVWAFYPLTDKIDKAKRRPVLIISNSQSNLLDNDCIVLPITKAIRAEPFSLIIETEDVMGAIPVSSELRCNKPFTLRSNLITDIIGIIKRDRLERAIELMHEAVKM